MTRNYYYLAVGLLCLLFAVSHTWNGLENVLPIMGGSFLGDGIQTDFSYLWHMIGAENFIFGIALAIMAFQRDTEKVRFTAWVIAAIIFARWIALTFTTVAIGGNITILLVDTVAMVTLIVLLVLGTRVKIKKQNLT